MTIKEAVLKSLEEINISRCEWKGWEHFQTKVLWSALAYNFRVLTNRTIEMMV